MFSVSDEEYGEYWLGGSPVGAALLFHSRILFHHPRHLTASGLMIHHVWGAGESRGCLERRESMESQMAFRRESNDSVFSRLTCAPSFACFCREHGDSSNAPIAVAVAVVVR